MHTASYCSPLGKSGTVSVIGPAGVTLTLLIDHDPRLHLNETRVYGTSPVRPGVRPVASGVGVYDDAGDAEVALSALAQGF